jgi:hypothetical protein
MVEKQKVLDFSREGSGRISVLINQVLPTQCDPHQTAEGMRAMQKVLTTRGIDAERLVHRKQGASGADVPQFVKRAIQIMESLTIWRHCGRSSL